MKTKIRARILTSIQIGSSHPGPGPIQPPRKNEAAIPEITNISKYSAIANQPYRTPPSGLREGEGGAVRLREPGDHEDQEADYLGHDVPDGVLCLDEPDQRQRAPHHDRAEQGEAHRDLVGDELRRGAHRAEEAVLRARRPPPEQQAEIGRASC